jgi:hypothetical protein
MPRVSTHERQILELQKQQNNRLLLESFHNVRIFSFIFHIRGSLLTLVFLTRIEREKGKGLENEIFNLDLNNQQVQKPMEAHLHSLTGQSHSPPPAN